MSFTHVESLILDRVQRDFPSTDTPFADMAAELGVGEMEFIETLAGLKSAGVVRNISGIFNASRLGFASCLVAFIIDEPHIDRAAALINAHPGVSHNYLRNHRYNIWFTLATDSEKKLEKTIKVLAERCGAEDYIILRTERLIKIGLMLQVGESAVPGNAGTAHATDGDTESHNAPAAVFTDEEKESIRLLQMDLPVEQEPFERLISAAGSILDAAALVKNMALFKKEKILRRYSGVLRHREAGYRSNAMTVWKPGASADIRSVTDVFSRERAISHLYLRTVYPGRWEYPLFAMIHARSDAELDGIIGRLSRESGITEYKALRSLREFKKERVVYFSSNLIEWEHQAGV